MEGGDTVSVVLEYSSVQLDNVSCHELIQNAVRKDSMTTVACGSPRSLTPIQSTMLRIHES